MDSRPTSPVIRRWIVSLLAALAAPAGARPAQAVTLDSVTPAAVQPGKSTTVQLRGKDLQEVKSVWLSFPARVKILKPATANLITCQVTIARSVPVQVGGIRVVTNKGVSNARLLLADDLPTVTATTKNHSRKDALRLAPASAVDGSIPAAGKCWYRLRVSRTQNISLEVFATRIGSPLDAALNVTNSTGKLVAAADDSVGLSNDCRLSFQANAGIYWISVRDTEHRGGAAYRFRLRCGDFPLASSVYPLAASGGRKSQATVLDRRQRDKLTVDVAKQWIGQEAAVSLPGRLGSALARVPTIRGVELVESEPNDSLKASVSINLPGAISARFDKRADVDWFRVVLPKGRIQIRGLTRRYGLPTMLLMRLCDKTGKTVATAMTTPPNPARIEHNITGQGVYYIRVEELHRRHGRLYAYRLDVDVARPKFAIQTPDRLVIKSGATANVPIEVQRQGYRGSIELSVQGSQHLKIVGNRTLGPKQSKLTIKLAANKNVKPGEPLNIYFQGEGIHETLVDAQQFEAEKYNRGNLGIYEGKFISDKMGGLNYAEYDVTIPTTGPYRLELRFAAKSSRPATLKVDGKVITKRIMAETTGGWTMKSQRWHSAQTLTLTKGKHVLRLERNGTFSHLDKLRLSRITKDKKRKSLIKATSTAEATMRKQLANAPYLPPPLFDRILVVVAKP